MEHHLVEPPQPARPDHQASANVTAAAPIRRWQSKTRDICHITAKASGFLASSYLMALGAPLLFFLAISGGDGEVLFAHLANLSGRFLAADHARRSAFLGEAGLMLTSLAMLLAAIRLPRFLRDLARELSGERL